MNRSSVWNAVYTLWPTYNIVVSRAEAQIADLREKFGHDFTYHTLLPILRGVREVFRGGIPRDIEPERLYLFLVLVATLISVVGPIVGVRISAPLKKIYFSPSNIQTALVKQFR